MNSLQANPWKFQYMLLSSSNIDICNVSFCIDDILLKPEPHVKILGVSLDAKLSFNQHVSISWKKPARQLNALARISRYLNLSSCSLLYFICFEAISIIVLWSGTFVEKQTEQHWKSPRTGLKNNSYHKSSYEDLMSAAEAPTMLARSLRAVLLEVFKSINMLNSDC